MPSSASLPTYTRAQVALHNKTTDLWIIVNKKVYDITKFLKRHPGGSSPLRYAGEDTSHVFARVHPKGTLEKIGAKFCIGTLDPADHDEPPLTDAADAAAGGGLRTLSDKTSYYSVSSDVDGYDTRKGGEEGREFGDHMASEGETSHIHSIILVLYGLLCGWSLLTSYVTSCSIWVMPTYYLVGMIGFYGWHVLAHADSMHRIFKSLGLNYLAELHEIHMEHHLERFPPGDFYGSAESYAEMYPKGRPSIWTLLDLTKTTNIADGTSFEDKVNTKKKKSGTSGVAAHSPLAHEWPVLFLVVLNLTVGMLPPFNSSLSTTGMVFVWYFVQGVVINAFHMSFHVRNFHLEKYAWYRELRTLHYIHHLGDMKSNLAMVNLGLDGFFNSLSVEDVRSNRRQSSNGNVSSSSSDNGDHRFYTKLAASKTQFPEGITAKDILSSAQHAGVVASVLGFDMPVDEKDGRDAKHLEIRNKGGRRTYPATLLRIMLTCAAMYVWFHVEGHADSWLQESGGAGADGGRQSHGAIAGGGGDAGHHLLAPLRLWLLEDPLRQLVACTLSDASCEIMGLFVVIVSIFGVSFRPMLSCILFEMFRLVVRVVGGSVSSGAVAPLNGLNVWVTSDMGGLPRLFVREVNGSKPDFISVRVGLAMIVAMEMLSVTIHGQGKQFLGEIKNWHKKLAATVAVVVLVVNVGAVVSLRQSWTFDVVIAMVVARYCTIGADRYSAWLDVFMP